MHINRTLNSGAHFPLLLGDINACLTGAEYAQDAIEIVD